MFTSVKADSTQFFFPGPGGGWPAAPGAAEASQPPDGAERP